MTEDIVGMCTLCGWLSRCSRAVLARHGKQHKILICDECRAARIVRKPAARETSQSEQAERFRFRRWAK